MQEFIKYFGLVHYKIPFQSIFFGKNRDLLVIEDMYLKLFLFYDKCFLRYFYCFQYLLMWFRLYFEFVLIFYLSLRLRSMLW